jgi:hypothetical protein
MISGLPDDTDYGPSRSLGTARPKGCQTGNGPISGRFPSRVQEGMKEASPRPGRWWSKNTHGLLLRYIPDEPKNSREIVSVGSGGFFSGDRWLERGIRPRDPGLATPTLAPLPYVSRS